MGNQVMRDNMKKVLLCNLRPHEELMQVEKELLAKKFEVVRVNTYEKFIQRTRLELFHVFIISFDAPSDLKRLLEKSRGHLPSWISPKVFLGPAVASLEGGETSILNQVFPSNTDPKLIAEFCEETYDLFYREPRRLTLEDFKIADILASLSLMHFSGEISVENENERCSIYFHGGKVVSASSSREDKRFGQILIQYGIVNDQQVHKVLEALKKDRKKIGQIFVDEGLLSNRKLLEMLALQVKHVVIPLFNWDKGTVEMFFEHYEDYHEFPIEIRGFRLVMEGLKLRFGEKELYDLLKPQPSSILCKQGSTLTWPMTLQEQKIFEILNQKPRMVDEVLSLKQFSRIEWLRALYGFRLFGIIDFELYGKPAAEPMRRKEKVIKELFTHPSHVPPTVPIQGKKVRATRPGYFVLLLAAGVLYVAWQFKPEDAVQPARMEERPASPTPSPRLANAVAVKNVAPPPKPPTPARAQKQAPGPSLSPKPVVNPSVQWVRNAKAFLEAKDFAAVERESLKILKHDPNHEQGLAFLGQAYMELDRYPAAEGVFKKLVGINSTSALGHLSLGTIYIEQNKMDLAAEHLRRFLGGAKAHPEYRSKIPEVQKVLQSLEASR